MSTACTQKLLSLVGVTFLILLYTLTVAVSIYGNALVLLIVIKSRSLKMVNNLLIANLAISDIIIAIIITPFQLYAALEQKWYLPEFMCKLCPFVQNVCIEVNILSMLLIAIYR